MKSARRPVNEVEDAANRRLESNVVAAGVDELAQMRAALASGGTGTVKHLRYSFPPTRRTNSRSLPREII
jgi:hypothetical protein